MKDYELTALERAVFAEMAERNPGTTPEMIYETSIHNDLRYIFHYFSTKSRPPLVDVSPLVKLRGLDGVTLYQCQVRDISPPGGYPDAGEDHSQRRAGDHALRSDPAEKAALFVPAFNTLLRDSQAGRTAPVWKICPLWTPPSAICLP